MIPGIFIDNLGSWLIQVFSIASVGALLPSLLRIRHPKSQLAYCHAVLLVCVALPLIQPWQHPLVIITGHRGGPAAEASPDTAWSSLILWILVAGIVAKLCWLGVGLWHLRRHQRAATPLHPIPETIREARSLTGADATFCVSREVSGPATLGFYDPVVLVPESFTTMGPEGQLSIACHELLHVRRRDWLATIVEEIAGAFFWFNPPVRWLLAQAKLHREQLVDAEVVRMTAAAPYIQALLSMAVVRKGRWALPAASFFTEGHLMDRMRLLLAGTNRSMVRLCVSYASIASVLAITCWSVLLLFPLVGEARVVAATAPPLLRPPVFLEPEAKPVEVEEEYAMFEIEAPPPLAQGPSPHQIDVIAPPDFFYFSGSPHSVPPPPPPPGSFRALNDFRILRLGMIANPEDIVRARIAVGDRAVLEVFQNQDGTIQRVIVQSRRFQNDTNPAPFVIPLDPADVPGAAESGGAASGVD